MKENQNMLPDPAEGSHDPQPKPGPSERKSTTHVVIIVLSLLLIASLGIAGYLTYQNSLLSGQELQEPTTPPASIPTPTPTITSAATTPPTATATPKTELAVPTEWKTFTSKLLGFSFDYPAEWGETSESINEADEQIFDLTGKGYTLDFSLIEGIYASGKSLDYSQGTGGRFYKGDPDKPKQVNAIVYIHNAGCSEMPLATNPYSGWIDFNLPGMEITGVRLKLPILSEKDIKKYNEEYKNEYKINDGEEEVCDKRIKAELFFKGLENKNLDNESLRNIYIFRRILNSSKISP